MQSKKKKMIMHMEPSLEMHVGTHTRRERRNDVIKVMSI